MTPMTTAMPSRVAKPDTSISQRTRATIFCCSGGERLLVVRFGSAHIERPGLACRSPTHGNRRSSPPNRPASGSTACWPRASPTLSRTRLKALILDGAVTIGGRTIRDPGYRVNAGDSDRGRGAAAGAGRARRARASRSTSSSRTTSSSSSTSRPAWWCIRPPATPTGTLVNALIAHCGDSLSGIGGVQAAGHRAPARQGHHRPDGGGQDRPRAPGARRAVRRSRPHRAAGARLSGLRLGRAGPAEGHHRRADRPASASAATRWRCAQGGREAITHWQVLERFAGTDGKPVASLIECRLETGRTHQIRVHLAHIGHPLLGDATYGTGFKTKATPAAAGGPGRAGGSWTTGPACLSAGFEHPKSGQTLEFRSELPADLARLRHSLSAG